MSLGNVRFIQARKPFHMPYFRLRNSDMLAITPIMSKGIFDYTHYLNYVTIAIDRLPRAATTTTYMDAHLRLLRVGSLSLAPVGPV